jgi:hypothetical protein
VVPSRGAARRLLFEGPRFDAVRQTHYEVDIDVGLQQRTLDLLDDRLDVLLVETGLPAEVIERPPEGAPEIIEYHLAGLGVPTAKALFVHAARADRDEQADDFRHRRNYYSRNTH